MTAENVTEKSEAEVHPKWTIEIVEGGERMERLIDSDPESVDEVSQFVMKAIDGLSHRLEMLRKTEFKSHGVRRGRVETKQVIGGRAQIIIEAERHLAALKGRESLPIRFIKIDGKIEGIEFLNHNGPKSSKP